MAAANGTPIRLVQDNGNLIELNATNIAFTVDRGVTPHSLPALGGRRFSIDLNKNKSLIVVEGVFTDDTQESGARRASGLIDFSVSQRGANEGDFNHVFNTNNNIDNLLLNSDNRVRLRNSAGDFFNLYFEHTAGTPGYNTVTDKLRIKSTDGTRITAVQFTQGVADWINNDVTDISATVVNSLLNQNSLGLNSALQITQDSAGTAGNHFSFPEFLFLNSGAYNGRKRSPHVEGFSGGVNSTAKSAGDKVMDLYGIMNNSSRNIPAVSIGGAASMVAAAGATLATGGLSLFAAIAFGGLAANSLAGDHDYIIGIQIPYNSKVQAGGDTYVARNFFMPTGNKLKAEDKGSEGNTLPASTTFDTGDNFTGIQGTVTKMDTFYDAGESVYGFRMDFSPIDNMI
tara:strand:+ start:140 stop:1339 length:1200 start_codon:yes stop_codon:yes gene_type:complete